MCLHGATNHKQMISIDSFVFHLWPYSPSIIYLIALLRLFNTLTHWLTAHWKCQQNIYSAFSILIYVSCVAFSISCLFSFFLLFRRKWTSIYNDTIITKVNCWNGCCCSFFVCAVSKCWFFKSNVIIFFCLVFKIAIRATAVVQQLAAPIVTTVVTTMPKSRGPEQKCFAFHQCTKQIERKIIHTTKIRCELNVNCCRFKIFCLIGLSPLKPICFHRNSFFSFFTPSIFSSFRFFYTNVHCT